MRPSKVKSVKAKTTKLLLPGFSAITWMSTIYCKYGKDIDNINKTDGIDSVLECHETIHVRQAESCSDSWFHFYMKYIWQYIRNLPLIVIGIYLPYYFIAFELEAYAYERMFYYPGEECVKWKMFNTLTLKEKFKFAKEYKNGEYNSFNHFVNKVVIPYIEEKEES